ncbi:MAG: tetratricopeptide repeat protein [Candidatus Omnitrophica bacterium]|nr:tetratricopeptide repeat protein [Candidatus Omnitrophota bacterium]
MDISQYLNRAQTALKEGELDLAVQYFQQILKRFPHHPEALQGMKDIKIALAKKKFPPWMREIQSIWYTLRMALGGGKSIYPQVELLYHCQPDRLRTALLYARSAEQSELWEEAHEAYERVLDQNATHIKALSGDAEVLVNLDRLDEAAERYQRLQALKPDDDRITHRLRDISARSYARVGIPENLQARRAAIEKEKREAIAPPEIMEDLEKTLEAYRKNPENNELGVQIASHYRKAALFDAANQTLAKILDKHPDYEPARREQARVWRQSGDLSIAQSLYQELLNEAPDDLALKDEYLQTTVALLEKQVKEGGAGGEAIAQLERMRIQRDQNRITYLEHYIIDHPEAFEQRLELGNLLLQSGRPDDAAPVLQRVIHEPSYAGRGFFMLGQCFRAKKDLALAVQQYEKALDFFKNKGYSHVLSMDLKQVYYYLGMAKEELGDKTGAKEAYGMIYSEDVNYRDIRRRYENLFT